jgi:hypothetical protein
MNTTYIISALVRTKNNIENEFAIKITEPDSEYISETDMEEQFFLCAFLAGLEIISKMKLEIEKT